MKQVTIENVKARIAQIENAASVMLPAGIGLSLKHEFELACLRQLLELQERVAELEENDREQMAELYRRNATIHRLQQQAAQLVPEEMTPQQASRSYSGEVRGYRDGWNACRAKVIGNMLLADMDRAATRKLQELTADNTAQQFEALATSAQPEIIGYEHRLICGELRRVPKFAGQDIEAASAQREPLAVVKHYTGNTYPTLKFAQDEWSVCGDRDDVQELADAINVLATSAGSGKP